MVKQAQARSQPAVVDGEISPAPEFTEMDLPALSRVAVIEMHGAIVPPEIAKDGPVVSIDTHLEAIVTAFAIEGAKAVVLDIDSPGGIPAEAYLLSAEIRRQKAETGIPVYAFIRGTGASAAYWLACAADNIYALPVSNVGSIGVVVDLFGRHKQLKREGIERRLLTAGKRKAMMDEFSPLKKSHLKREQKKMDKLHRIFFEAVRESRGDRLQASDKKLMSGEAWLGHKALKLGLIDGLGDMRGVVPGLIDGPPMYYLLRGDWGDAAGGAGDGPDNDHDAIPGLPPAPDGDGVSARGARFRYIWSRDTIRL